LAATYRITLYTIQPTFSPLIAEMDVGREYSI
jgi:hypothetical protein